MQNSNSLIFILSKIKISIFNIMGLSAMIRFLKYDYPALYCITNQFHFALVGRPPLGSKNLIMNSPEETMISLKDPGHIN